LTRLYSQQFAGIAVLFITKMRSYLPQMHKNSSIQSAQPSVRSSKLLQLLLAKAKLLRIHVPQASHISAFDPVTGTHLPKSMVGFAATLDHVSAGSLRSRTSQVFCRVVCLGVAIKA